MPQVVEKLTAEPPEHRSADRIFACAWQLAGLGPSKGDVAVIAPTFKGTSFKATPEEIYREADGSPSVFPP